MTRWTPRACDAARAGVRKHGLRVICAACAHECRHFPADGRLRDRKCPRCHAVELHSKAWAKRYPLLFGIACDQAQGIQSALHRLR